MHKVEALIIESRLKLFCADYNHESKQVKNSKRHYIYPVLSDKRYNILVIVFL